MKPISTQIKEKPWLGWVIFLVSVIVVFFAGLLASSVIERRAEAVYAYKPVTEVDQFEPRNAVWGENYPSEFQSYYKTADTSFQSMFNSSRKTDALADNPRMVILWAGYAFSKDYNQPRGHFYAVEDARNTLRTGAPKGPDDGPQPATCWSCKSPDVPRMMQQLGSPEAFYKRKWASLGAEIVNPIGCADCHDARTMNLRISRPALVEAFERQGKDISKASHQEMRSLVCAQCHVEYYFKGEGKYLTFPWDKGFAVEDMEAYYDEYEFTDWVHALSKTPMLKAQHPDYEVYMKGIHAERGVACADCHMPYQSEGGKKFTNHHIHSPLGNINASCQVCHRESEQDLRKNVYDRQLKVKEIRDKAEQALVAAHLEAKAAWEAGATESEMAPVLKLIRHAQWRWDYAAAGHGNSFHAPVELLRILGTSVDKAQDARILLARVLSAHGIAQPLTLPDVSTKEKAQQVIGLDMPKLRAEKVVFLQDVVKQWLAEAEKREASYGKK
ncbi:MAG TPA: ammonia-forming cytochrome c nitrite reductase [Bacteroidales bacterium]|nr:ammonia-forming cytochrome c nitrite reductase [Bacteroidales bacterium]HSA42464.1 ammonia-forming cytochrome c nitrite reductase [Bacteroidales bacterium]